MAMIHVARDGAKLGEFSLEQIREGLGTDQFHSTDLGWQPGMSRWIPLGRFEAEAPSAVTTSSEAPLGATAISIAGGPESGLPWEHRQQLGFVKAFVDTVKVILMKPAEAFTVMKREGNMTGPLFFAVVGGSIGSIVLGLFELGFQSPDPTENDGLIETFGRIPVMIGFFLVIPLVSIVWTFIFSGITHISLMLLGGGKRPFDATFRVVCFASGTAQLFNVIPLVGGLIAFIYGIVLECIGLSRAQEITTGKAVLAVLLPLIVCIGVGGLALGLILGSSGIDLLKSFKP